jgi:hypothetical protein
MTDIIERLNNATWSCELMVEAADEIERLHKIELQFLALQEERVRWFADNEWLTADNERLRALLQKLDWKSIDKDNMEFSCRVPYNVMDEIRRALEPKP